jgi:hypothetical protein
LNPPTTGGLLIFVSHRIRRSVPGDAQSGERRVIFAPTVPIRDPPPCHGVAALTGSSMDKAGGGFMVRLRMGALVGVAAIVFAACGTAASPSPSASSPGTSSEPGTSAAPSAGGEIKEGGSFIVALPGDIDNTDPALISDSNSS